MVFENVLEAFDVAAEFDAESFDLIDDLFHALLKRYAHAGVFVAEAPEGADYGNDAGCSKGFNHVLGGDQFRLAALAA